MEYRPLSTEDREIRLLTLVEGSNSVFLECKLGHWSLFNPPVYTALSYSWGNPDITKAIIVNGVKVQATINLEAALRQLQAAGYTKVWADALCINQEDREERSRQILIMRNVYSCALEVVVWLGIETEDSNIAVDCIENEPRSKARTLDNVWSIGKVTTDDDVSIALKAFFNRPYWKRVWILQEVIAAQRATVYCGARSTSMELVEEFLSKTIKGQEFLKTALVPRFKSFRKDPITGMLRPLMELLISSSASMATDPRDKIFALRSLASDGQEIVPLPNYKQPLNLAFQEITLSILKLKGYPGLISLRSAERTPTDHLPSWVPDWADLSSAMRPWHPWLLDPAPPDTKLVEDGFSTHRIMKFVPITRSNRPDIKCENEVLQLRGLVHDLIDGISTQIKDNQPRTEAEQSRCGMVQPQYQQSGNVTDMDTAFAIACSLCMEAIDIGSDNKGFIANMMDPMSALGFPSNLPYLHMLQQYRGREIIEKSNPRLRNWLDDNKSFEIRGKRLKDWINTCLIPNCKNFIATVPYFVNLFRGDESDLQRFINRFSKVVGHGMRLFVTRNGTVGMAHPQAQPGDTICTIQDCTMPIILRKSGQYYRVVGEAYMHPIHKFAQVSKGDPLTDIFIN